MGLARQVWAAGALVACLASVGAVAQEGQSPGPSRGQSVTTTRGVDVRFALPHAIGVAERDAKGRAISAELTPFPKGGGALEVTMMRADGTIVKYQVDANTGETVNRTEQTVEAYVSRLDPGRVQAEPFGMAKAIEKAQTHLNGGIAIGAEVQDDGGALSYEVTILKDDGETDLVVRSDGQVVQG